MPTLEQLQKAADELCGSSGVYDHTVTKELGIDESELEELFDKEGLLYRCANCGWWTEPCGYLNDEGREVCSDCASELELDEH